MAKKNPGAHEARLAARQQAQQQIKAQERRTTIYIVVGAVVALTLFGGLVWFIIQQGKVPTMDELVEDAALPAGGDATGGILIGQDLRAGGDVPDDAIRVDVYQDFMCPYCGVFEMTNGEDLEELAAAGDIALYVHPLALLNRYSQGTDFSTRSANALATIADGSPEHVLEFTRLMYMNQPEQNSQGLSDEEMASIAVQAGVPQDVANTIKDGKFKAWALAATEQSSKDQVRGTPSVMINGTLIEQTEVPYMEPGVLRAYIESQ